MKRTFIVILLALCILPTKAQFVIRRGHALSVACDTAELPVVHTALSLLERDYKNVFSDTLQRKANGADIVVGTLGKSALLDSFASDVALLQGRQQAFLLKVLHDGRLLIAGSDAHGTAYGVMELCRLLGVSPWEWWADATPKQRDTLSLAADFQTLQSPSVELRGIFINDEDWGLSPWVHYNYEPNWEYNLTKVGPKTHERIFELLLRLRANTFWPAMHECTEPFFLTKGNRELAARYGIYIGGSHCEPMACSAAVEWKLRGEGDYDYVNNSASVYKFWEDRVKEVAQQEIFYTVGMRGVHDGQMQGAKTVEEQKAVLTHVLSDQRALLQKYVNPDVTQVPQVFIPYKEVLDIYNAGLQVPDDITLMWCDDNYGYISHFPTQKERARQGGNGVYYHVSYWGRPCDYLWLGTFSPFLLYQQMKQAYDHGIQKIWILNVGDIKPAEYQVELFLDMAWDIHQVEEEGVARHLGNFLNREFGNSVGEQLLPIMQEHYRLAFIRKPEFMGNTRTEETTEKRIVRDLPWSENHVRQRLADYKSISDKAEMIYAEIPMRLQDAYFHLVKYPLQAATQMNYKTLYAQLARHGKAEWERSDAAYDSIVSLTRLYNTGINNHGKWLRFMDHQPRRLSVFEPMIHETASKPLAADPDVLQSWNATECSGGTPHPCEGLGYEGKAATIGKGEALSFDFENTDADSIVVEIQLLPNHPVEGDRLGISLMVDKGERQEIFYQTKGRSEEWKENVLQNRSIRRMKLSIKQRKQHRLTISALTEGVVLDQVRVINY